MKFLDLDPHLHAERRIEILEWLVKEEDTGLPYDGSSERDALLLAARQLPRQSIENL